MIYTTMRFYALYFAIIVYAVFSDPTPDAVGMAEIIVAVFLCLAVGIAPIHAVAGRKFDHPTLSYHRLFFLWMMSVPLVTGVMHGYAAADIVRDIIPVMFLVLPLCFAGHVEDRHAEHLAKIMVAAGVLFALRYLWTAMPAYTDLGWRQAPHDMLYLANSPLIPFAAIMGFAWLTKPDGWHWAHRLAGLVVLGICVLAMVAMVQRAPIILVAAACGVLTLVRLGRHPLRVVVIIGLVLAAFYPLMPLALQVWDGLMHKTISVGWNNRWAENAAVRDMIWRGDILTSVFGYGWGHVWQSPAVSDEWVRYTHNMNVYYWLKSGLVGLALSAVFFILWMRDGFALLRHNIVIALAIMVPFTIHSVLYTGFKTLDYAILLLLLTLHTSRLWPLNLRSSS